MKILVAGDLSLQDRACRTWTDGDLQHAFADVKDISEKCNYSIVNLESPVVSSSEAIVKDGPSLRNTQSVFDIIKYCNFNIVTLANNHLKDYNCQGVLETLQNCKEHGLLTVGAGRELRSARTPLILKDNQNGLVVGVLNVCEHESSIASAISAGAAPLDYPNLYEDICTLKNQADIIIVIIHGGRECYQLPTPRMKREYRMISDWGANIIINHHQHCYSGYEEYKGKLIFYGLGNFFFDDIKERDSTWNKGLLLELTIDKSKIDFSLHPYEQCNKDAVINIISMESVIKDIEKLNHIIANDQLLEQSFLQMVDSAKPLYPFLPFGNRLYRFFYFKDYLPALICKKNRARIVNAISCETHREVLMGYLRKYLYID